MAALNIDLPNRPLSFENYTPKDLTVAGRTGERSQAQNDPMARSIILSFIQQQTFTNVPAQRPSSWHMVTEQRCDLDNLITDSNNMKISSG
jgi:hypothetical protein